MTTHADETPATDTLSLEVAPEEVDAGASLTLTGTVAAISGGDLRGRALLVDDGHRTPVAELPIIDFDGEVNRTETADIPAPTAVGTHCWRAVLPAAEPGGPARLETVVDFTVAAHRTSVVVWDVPPTIEAGERFRVKVGAKCSSECRPEKWIIEIRDQDGTLQASAQPGEAPWHGTRALRYAEVELVAPQAEGLHRWTVSAPGEGHALPHAQHSARLGVRVVPQPELSLRVEAYDQKTGRPLAGMNIRAHPYRATTGADGVAELPVAKGVYTVFIAGDSYIPYRTGGELSEDTTIRATLAPDVGLSDTDLWA